MEKENDTKEGSSITAATNVSGRESLVKSPGDGDLFGKMTVGKSRKRSWESCGEGSTDGDDSSSAHQKRHSSSKKMKKLKRKKSKKSSGSKKKKYSSDSSDSTSTSSSSEDDRRKKRHRRKKSKKCKKKSYDKSPVVNSVKAAANDDDNTSFGPPVPDSLAAKSKAMAPMSKEEWEKRQSVIRRVYDEDTGRYRLVKGDGEIVEECVSRERHKEINKQATTADGSYFQKQLSRK